MVCTHFGRGEGHHLSSNPDQPCLTCWWVSLFSVFLQVANQVENSGLQLNLKVRETCRQLIKTPEPVLATLHVNLNNGRREDVNKCKELLSFLKEQVLPKTVKLISLKRIKKIKDKDKSNGGNFLGCIWPGKSKKRYCEFFFNSLWQKTLWLSWLLHNPLLMQDANYVEEDNWTIISRWIFFWEKKTNKTRQNKRCDQNKVLLLICIDLKRKAFWLKLSFSGKKRTRKDAREVWKMRRCYNSFVSN